MIQRVGHRNNPARLRSASPVLLILLLATLALWPSPASLLRYWLEVPDYQHGFLVAAIVLAWMGRELWRGAADGAGPSTVAGLVLLPLLLLWVVAMRGGIDILHQLLWPVIVTVSVWAVAGTRASRRLALPAGLLFAAIPVWDYGLPILQRLSIFSTEQILGLLGVPATVSEYRVTIPEGAFAIVEGCSGKRYFIVTMAVAYLAISMNSLRGWRALLFLLFAAWMSMLMNWIRIVIVILAGHLTDMQHYFVAVEHKSLGNALFVVLIVAVLWLGRRWSGKPAKSAASTEGGPASAGSGRHLGPAMLASAALLVIAALAVRFETDAPSLRLNALPIATGDWISPLPAQAGWRPQYAQPDDERRVAYLSASGLVELYVNLYSDQSNGRELIHYGNNIIAPSTWSESWDKPLVRLDSAEHPLSILQMQGPDGRLWLLSRVYVVKGRFLRTKLAAKLAYGWYSIGGQAPSGVLAAASVCDARNCNNARMLLDDFWNNMWMPLEALMPAGSPPTP